MKRRRLPIRVKLTVATILPLSVAILVCWLAGMSIIHTQIVNQAQDRVRTDLNSAWEIFANEIDHIRDTVKFTGQTPYTARALSSGEKTELANILAPLLMNEQLDILNAVDRYGQVVYRAANPGVSGDYQKANPLIAQALEGKVASGTMVFESTELEKEDPILAGQAIVEIRSTPHSKRYTRKVESGGMMLMAAAPVRDESGKVVGALWGGTLVNGDNGIVDKIRRIVYEGVQFEGKNIGTATIFLGDVRVSTNVYDEAGKRALGTLMSEEVYNKVIVNGGRWIGRAFVVNDWYVSSYMPIRDIRGATVGSLYVGMKEKPYVNIKYRLNLIYALVLFLGTFIGIVFSGYIGRRLSRPISTLETVARRVAAGERGLEIRVDSGDEIEDLADELREMTATLTRQENELRALNRNLEEKVLERTAELEEKNLMLVRTQKDLVRAGKLAELGTLAAGVAHEINNPMAIIRGNAELLQMALPPEDTNREEVDTIAQQVTRVEKIVSSLLTFARHEKKHLHAVRINEMVQEIVRQIGHQVPLTGIVIRPELAPDLPPLQGDADQLRQVFTNLVINAIQAMKDGGELRVTTAPAASGESVEITFADTGCGMTPEVIEKIFTPFFTTKPAGTGMGLSISYGIIKDHRGNITVTSERGKGTTFRVILPLEQ